MTLSALPNTATEQTDQAEHSESNASLQHGDSFTQVAAPTVSNHRLFWHGPSSTGKHLADTLDVLVTSSDPSHRSDPSAPGPSKTTRHFFSARWTPALPCTRQTLAHIFGTQRLWFQSVTALCARLVAAFKRGYLSWASWAFGSNFSGTVAPSILCLSRFLGCFEILGLYHGSKTMPALAGGRISGCSKEGFSPLPGHCKRNILHLPQIACTLVQLAQHSCHCFGRVCGPLP
jgi:hypothetical protein